MTMGEPILEVLLPVYNEATTVESTIREIYKELSSRLSLAFIVCEDGSTDGTAQVLKRLSDSVPMRLIVGNTRKGYAQAVIGGMHALQAKYMLCLDGDGQCDPRDFWKFWDIIDQYDAVVGWRTNRKDTFWRRACSRTFYAAYQFICSVPLNDPSCPFVLMHREVVQKLVPELGEMNQGLWWEFNARLHRRGFSMTEVPIEHRNRSNGTTRVYALKKIPSIGLSHFSALLKIWRQTIPTSKK
jgi:glycosyltransferase involved in cell wall biosynthesis